MQTAVHRPFGNGATIRESDQQQAGQQSQAGRAAGGRAPDDSQAGQQQGAEGCQDKVRLDCREGLVRLSESRSKERSDARSDRREPEPRVTTASRKQRLDPEQREHEQRRQYHGDEAIGEVRILPDVAANVHQIRHRGGNDPHEKLRGAPERGPLHQQQRQR